jgi:hypothetical protein
MPIQPKNSGLKFVQQFLKHTVEEMTKNASCFVILFHVDI